MRGRGGVSPPVISGQENNQFDSKAQSCRKISPPVISAQENNRFDSKAQSCRKVSPPGISGQENNHPAIESFEINSRNPKNRHKTRDSSEFSPRKANKYSRDYRIDTFSGDRSDSESIDSPRPPPRQSPPPSSRAISP